ncbi:hypothetical protein AAEX28_15865 [Lentisphaerota bacterium WC36G]|nr:hypothetical protein LJT99_15125 [Lentisphaerae bacterium WC36]UDQ98436.1 hypothetical protein LJT99_02625 [Lentisphaerae bacterium WC36]
MKRINKFLLIVLFLFSVILVININAARNVTECKKKHGTPPTGPCKVRVTGTCSTEGCGVANEWDATHSYSKHCTHVHCTKETCDTCKDSTGGCPGDCPKAETPTTECKGTPVPCDKCKVITSYADAGNHSMIKHCTKGYCNRKECSKCDHVTGTCCSLD